MQLGGAGKRQPLRLEAGEPPLMVLEAAAARGRREAASGPGRLHPQGREGPAAAGPRQAWGWGAGGGSEVRGPRGRRGAGAGQSGARARPPRAAGGGAGWGRGGRGLLTITNRSLGPPPLSHRPRRPWVHSLRQRVPAGPSGCGGGGWRVCRSLSPGGPTPARSSSAEHQRQRPHFRFPCHSGRRPPEVPPHPAGLRVAPGARSSALRALPAVPATPRAAAALFCALPPLLVDRATLGSVFPSAAPLRPAFTSPPRGEGARDAAVASRGRHSLPAAPGSRRHPGSEPGCCTGQGGELPG